MKLTDAGLETVLIFDEGFELPCFAAFPLVDSDEGRAALRRYYAPLLELARDREVPLILSAPTWRASADWGRQLGYEGDELTAVNRRAVALVEAVRDEVLEPAERGNVVIEGSVGPRGDAYKPTLLMDAEAAERYHAGQLQTFADAGCPQATALTLTYPDEGIGIVRAGGLRANASTLSHAELDEAEELDSGDPADLAKRYVALRRDLSELEVVGGCCGTDVRHVTAICDAWLAADAAD